MTLCLLATLSFNLSHLMEAPQEGQTDLSSQGDQDSLGTAEELKTKLGEDAYYKLFEGQNLPEGHPGRRPTPQAAAPAATGAPATTPASSAAAPAAPAVAAPAPAVVAPPATAPAAAATPSVRGNVCPPGLQHSEGARIACTKVNINGREVDASFIDVGYNTTAVRLSDPNLDPRKNQGGQCPSGACGGLLISEPFQKDLNFLAAVASQAFRSQGEVGRTPAPAAPAVAAPAVDLATIPVDKMTEDQKQERAQELLDKLTEKCGKEKNQTRELSCYTTGVKSLLNNSSTKKIFAKAEDKVEAFYEGLSGTISSALTSSNFNASTANQIRKLHDALPGKFENARRIIIEASGQAAAAQGERIQNLDNRLDTAETRLKSAELKVRKARTPEERFRAQNEVLRAQQQVIRLSNEKGRLELNFNNNVVSRLRVENYVGLSRSKVGSELQDRLMDRYDEMTDQIFDNHRRGSTRASREFGVPQERTDREKTGVNHGVSRLTRGQKLHRPSGSGSATINRGTTLNRGLPVPNRSRF